MSAWTLLLSWKLVDLDLGIDVENDQEFTSLHGNYHFPCKESPIVQNKLLALISERYSLEGGDDRGKKPRKEWSPAIIHKLTSTKALRVQRNHVSGLQDSLANNMPL